MSGSDSCFGYSPNGGEPVDEGIEQFCVVIRRPCGLGLGTFCPAEKVPACGVAAWVPSRRRPAAKRPARTRVRSAGGDQARERQLQPDRESDTGYGDPEVPVSGEIKRRNRQFDNRLSKKLRPRLAQPAGPSRRNPTDLPKTPSLVRKLRTTLPPVRVLKPRTCTRLRRV